MFYIYFTNILKKKLLRFFISYFRMYCSFYEKSGAVCYCYKDSGCNSLINVFNINATSTKALLFSRWADIKTHRWNQTRLNHAVQLTHCCLNFFYSALQFDERWHFLVRVGICQHGFWYFPTEGGEGRGDRLWLVWSQSVVVQWVPDLRVGVGSPPAERYIHDYILEKYNIYMCFNILEG